MSDNDPSAPSPPKHGEYWHKLHNFLQPRGLSGKLYSKEENRGTEDAPTWHSVCTIDGKEYGRGMGKTIRVARNDAARVAFCRVLFENVRSVIKSHRGEDFFS